jgi:hypothetical protein
MEEQKTHRRVVADLLKIERLMSYNKVNSSY